MTDDYRNQVFVPTVAEFPNDMETSLELQKPLADIGYRLGLMLFIRGADAGEPRVFDRENIEKQYENLAKHSEIYGGADIITMLPNMPVGDIDFLHNGSFAKDHVMAGIDFVRGLPIGGRKILTFHLNSLGTEEEFRSKTRDQWYAEFDGAVLPHLRDIGDRAEMQGVDVLVETLGVPEFGDMKAGEGQTYNGAPDLRSLRSPFYIFAGNHIQRGIRESGLGICLDLCHNRTIYQAMEGMNDNMDLDRGILLEDRKDINIGYKWDDVVKGPDYISGKLLHELSGLSSVRDMVHLNDGLGRYTSGGGVYQEGVALGQGDIENMPDIIRRLNKKQIPFVLEINEKDFDNRPNTRTSVDYLVDLAKAE